MKSLIISMFFVIYFISYSFAEMPIKFFKGEINIKLEKNYVHVQGLYFFENKSNFEIDVIMVYQFPINSNHLYPEKINVLDPINHIDLTKKKNGIEWVLHFEPNSVETVFIEYKQKINNKSAVYILDKLWKEKINKLQFIIEAPLEFKELSISMEPDSVRTEEDKQFYYITRRYFLPEEDLKISWQW